MKTFISGKAAKMRKGTSWPGNNAVVCLGLAAAGVSCLALACAVAAGGPPASANAARFSNVIECFRRPFMPTPLLYRSDLVRDALQSNCYPLTNTKITASAMAPSTIDIK